MERNTQIKKFPVFLLVFIISNICFLFAEDFPLRNISWGMTPHEVSRSEKDKPLQASDKTIVYMSDFYSTPALLTYFFTDKKLISAAYVFKMNEKGESSGTPQEYIELYNKLKSVLTEKYGQPEPGEEQFLPEGGSEVPSPELADAVSKGKVKLIRAWSSQPSIIKIGLSQKGGKCLLVISYSKPEN